MRARTMALGAALAGLILLGVSSRVAAEPAAKVKGIWEPVNYGRDVEITSVHFANGERGWVTTANGVILFTEDAGESWTAQAGDPDSEAPALDGLRFLDATHGWATSAVTGGGWKLYRTTDGRSWEQFGEIPYRGQSDVLTDYVFTSPQRGIATIGGYLVITRDGGRNWADASVCKLSVQVQGLARETQCWFQDLSFPTVEVGYASVMWRSDERPNNASMALAKTEDGGATWKLRVLPDLVGEELATDSSSVAFTDERHGVLRLSDGKSYVTDDGGTSWRGLMGPLGRDVRFADPEVALVLDGWETVTMQVSADGGRNWSTRKLRFPAHFVGFSFPRRDRAFAVGEHGMIYRYREVPADYTVANTVEALLLPGYGEPLRGDLARARTRLDAIEAKIAALPPPSPQAGQAAVSSGSAVETASAPVTASGFTQDVSLTEEQLGVEASPAMADCCSAEMQGLAADLVSVGLEMPRFAGRFRNANLLFVGLNTIADLITRSHAIREAFVTLKRAPDAPTAAAALQRLSIEIESASEAIATGFDNLTSPDPTASAGADGGFVDMTAAQAQDSAASQAAPPAASGKSKKIKDRIKKALPF